MKKIVILIFVCIFNLAYAQDRNREQASPEEQLQQMLNRLDQDLQLTDIQKNELHSFLEDQMKENQKLRAQRKAARKEIQQHKADRQIQLRKIQSRRSAMQQNMIEQRAEIEAKMKEILTPEQFEKWIEIKEERLQVISERRARALENRAKTIRKNNSK